VLLVLAAMGRHPRPLVLETCSANLVTVDKLFWQARYPAGDSGPMMPCV